MSIGRAFAASALHLLWPARCAGCDAMLAHDTATFCGPCAQSLSPVVFPCPGCALPMAPATAAWRSPTASCSYCGRQKFAFSRAFAAFEYGEALASAIIRMKHGDRPDLARRLARVFADTVARALDVQGAGAVDAVIPVPLSNRRLRRRGFNQALALARTTLGHIRTVRAAVGRVPALERRLLVRIRDTPTLGRSGPKARRLNVRGAFDVVSPARVSGRRFLVIDDVMTTGATLDECARTLVRWGAAEVRVAALARALD